jgi:hypothetical protein
MPGRDPNTTLHAMASSHSSSFRSISGENITVRSPRLPRSPTTGATTSSDMATSITFSRNLPPVFDAMEDSQGSSGAQDSPRLLSLGPPLIEESYVPPFPDPWPSVNAKLVYYLTIGLSFI